MTLDAIVARQQRIQTILIDLTRGNSTETEARDAMRNLRMSSNEIDRLLTAIRANIIIPR